MCVCECCFFFSFGAKSCYIFEKGVHCSVSIIFLLMHTDRYFIVHVYCVCVCLIEIYTRFFCYSVSLCENRGERKKRMRVSSNNAHARTHAHTLMSESAQRRWKTDENDHYWPENWLANAHVLFFLRFSSINFIK